MDALMELMAARVETFTGTVDAFGGQPIQNAYNQQESNYSPSYYHRESHYHPDSSWSNNNHVQPFYPWISSQSEVSYEPPPPQEKYSNVESLLAALIEKNEKKRQEEEYLGLEENLTTTIEQDEMRMNTYTLSSQPPPQEEDESKLEERLVKYIEKIEMGMSNRESSIQILANHVEQLTSTINFSPQDDLPCVVESILEMVGKEKCWDDLLEGGEEFHVEVGDDEMCSHPVMEDDVGKEKLDDDDQARESTVLMQGSSVPLVQFLHPIKNFVECFRIEFAEEDEELTKFKFGGLKSCTHADERKEMTKRRHDVTIFARNPD